MTRVLALADQSKIGCITQRRFAKVGTKTHPQRGAGLDRNGLSVSTETACRFEPKSPVGNSEICSLTFTRQKFHSKWQELSGFFGADRIASKSVAPLPYLVVPAFPLRLNDELVLDRLTDDEVTRCYQVGVIRPTSLRYPLIYGVIAVGMRRTTFLPKVIQQGDAPPVLLPKAEEEGSFGRRPYFRDDLVTGDVL